MQPAHPRLGPATTPLILASFRARARAMDWRKSAGGAQTVELADKGEPRSGGAAGEPSLDPGEGEARTRRESQGAHMPGDERGSFHLIEAGLGIAQDRFAEINDRVGVTIDRLANRALQLILAAHRRPPAVKVVCLPITQSPRFGRCPSAESIRQSGFGATIATTRSMYNEQLCR